MIGTPVFPLVTDEGAPHPLKLALDRAADEFAALGIIEPDAVAAGDAAGAYIGQKIRAVLRAHARALPAGKPWHPGRAA
jgi:hypothetical protein